MAWPDPAVPGVAATCQVELVAGSAILLPQLGVSGKGDLGDGLKHAAAASRAHREGPRLQGVPRFFYSPEELQDTPFPPAEDKDHRCLAAISLVCTGVVAISLLGIITCIVILIFNEVLPRPCPAHHVECMERDWPSNPYWRSVVLLCFLCFVVMLPMGIAACQSNCICLVPFLRDDGCWFRCVRRTLAWQDSCGRSLRGLKRLRCCRRSKARVQPGESRSSSLGRRHFGETEAFGNLMIIPVPAPMPQKPAVPGYPRRWCHTLLPNFHEVVELTMDGEGSEVARLILNDSTWHCPPRCERVFRIESCAAWAAYAAAKAHALRGDALGAGAAGRCVEFLGDELDPRINEQILFYGTTVEVSLEVQRHAQVPDTVDCPRHVLLRRFGGGAQFCDRGFLAHEQATEAGYNKESLDASWAVLVCRVVLGRSLEHRGQHAGPRLHREWARDQYGSILIRRDGHREFLLPPDVRNAAYPEYVVILR